ncbi:hypothetical protein IAU59_002092 [Kwoniella sp. CBS 9459]
MDMSTYSISFPDPVPTGVEPPQGERGVLFENTRLYNEVLDAQRTKECLPIAEGWVHDCDQSGEQLDVGPYLIRSAATLFDQEFWALRGSTGSPMPSMRTSCFDNPQQAYNHSDASTHAHLPPKPAWLPVMTSSQNIDSAVLAQTKDESLSAHVLITSDGRVTNIRPGTSRLNIEKLPMKAVEVVTETPSPISPQYPTPTTPAQFLPAPSFPGSSSPVDGPIDLNILESLFDVTAQEELEPEADEDADLAGIFSDDEETSAIPSPTTMPSPTRHISGQGEEEAKKSSPSLSSESAPRIAQTASGRGGTQPDGRLKRSKLEIIEPSSAVMSVSKKWHLREIGYSMCCNG